MRIVIDARIIQFGGVYSYTRALVRAISKIDKNNQYLIIYDAAHGKLNLQQANVEEFVIHSDNPYKWLYWNKTKLPRLINEFDADIYHSLKQVTNFQTNAKTIFTIHSAYPFFYPQYLNLQEKLYWVPMYRRVARHAD